MIQKLKTLHLVLKVSFQNIIFKLKNSLCYAVKNIYFICVRKTPSVIKNYDESSHI